MSQFSSALTDLYGTIAHEEGPRRGNALSLERLMTAEALQALGATPWILACFLKRLVAGGMARLPPGFNVRRRRCAAMLGAANSVVAAGPAYLLGDPENRGSLSLGLVAFEIFFRSPSLPRTPAAV